MNRNVESHFALNPTNIDIRRSTFDRSHSLKTSFNVGDIVPFFLDEVLPGDTFNVDTSKVVRLQTLLTPVMDNRTGLLGLIGNSSTVKIRNLRGFLRQSMKFLRLLLLLMLDGLLELLPTISVCLLAFLIFPLVLFPSELMRWL